MTPDAGPLLTIAGTAPGSPQFAPLGRDIRALLVWPKFPPSFYGLEGSLCLVPQRAHMAPLALATVAALLPAHWRLRLIDRAFQEVRDEDIRGADLVVISAMHAQRADARAILDRCRALGCRTLIGGPWANIEPEVLLGLADHVVAGEVEDTMAGIAADLESGHARRFYRTERRPDVAHSPIPRYDLLDLKQYLTVGIQFSRGCPFQCEFCDIPPAYGRRPRTKKPAQFIAELERLYGLGWRGRVTIADDNFIGNHHAALELVRELARWQKEKGYPFEFSTEASVDLSQRLELLDAMAEANFIAIFLGIETPSAESLRETKKHQNLRRDLVDQVRVIQGRGQWVVAGFIVGFDSDGASIFDDQIDLIERAAIPCAAFNLLQAIPTTPLYDRLQREGRLNAVDPVFMVPSSRPNFRTVMADDVLVAGAARLLRTIYDPRRFFDSASRSVEYWRPSPAQRFPNFSLSYALAWIARSVWIQGCRSSYRREYWRFWGRSIRRWWRDPVRLQQACSILMWAHHLFRYYGAMADGLVAEWRNGQTAAARQEHRDAVGV
jgi:radical SAM superfamily enzyme YgiQ (UPF0313 family)